MIQRKEIPEGGVVLTEGDQSMHITVFRDRPRDQFVEVEDTDTDNLDPM